MSSLHDAFACTLLSGNRAGMGHGRCADVGIVPVVPNESTAIAIDTLVEGVHFRPQADAADVAWKAMSVNLSDLAAMGASAKSAAVNLQWPASRQAWLRGFRRGLEAAAREFFVDIIAASVTPGPGIVTVEVFGAVPFTLATMRRGARAGDAIFVTGTLGDAGLGLGLTQGKCQVSVPDAEFLLGRLDRPTPRLAAGGVLRDIASAAIDISDGLTGDLGHVLTSSGVGATVEIETLPRSPQLRRNASKADGWRFAACAGDDYELCFTIPAERLDKLETARSLLGVDVTRIGVIEDRPGLRFVLGSGESIDPGTAFDHFA